MIRVIQIFPIIYLGKYQHRKPNLVDRKELEYIHKINNNIISYFENRRALLTTMDISDLTVAVDATLDEKRNSTQQTVNDPQWTLCI